MGSQRFKDYIQEKKEMVERIERDLFYIKTSKRKPRKFNEKEEKGKIQKLYRGIIEAEGILNNIEKHEDSSDSFNRIVLFSGKYGDKNLAVNYFNQEESVEPLVKKINEVEEMFKNCGRKNEKGFIKYVSEPWARLLERKMKEKEYEKLSKETSIQIFAKVLSYRG